MTSGQKNCLSSMCSAPMDQVDSGKAWEYALASRCADIFNSGSPLIDNSPRKRAQDAYGLLDVIEREKADKAAGEVAEFLQAFDARFNNAKSILMQSDMAGRHGDVSDIIVKTQGGDDIGISAKHRHNALKHSRLSDKIDFGKDWYRVPCSDRYWNRVRPIFAGLRDRENENWRDLPNKHRDYYVPVLEAFIDEVSEFACVKSMMSYLVGNRDFYKVIKENGTVSIESFNINGTLKWGNRLRLPTTIESIQIRKESMTTVDIVMNRGWSISFRIHNAESRVGPSLKFDVRLVGAPENRMRNSIPYGG